MDAQEIPATFQAPSDDQPYSSVLTFEQELTPFVSILRSLCVLSVALAIIQYSTSGLQPSRTGIAEQAWIQYDSLLNETAKEAWVRWTLPQLHEERLLNRPGETHQECLFRGANYAHARLGRYYMDYPDVCNSTVEWVQSNCDRLFWTPQVVVTKVVEIERLKGWALRRAFVKHHVQKFLGLVKSWVRGSVPPEDLPQSVPSAPKKPVPSPNVRPIPLPSHFHFVDCERNPPCKLVCIPTSTATTIAPSKEMLEEAQRRVERTQRAVKRGDLFVKILETLGFVCGVLYLAVCCSCSQLACLYVAALHPRKENMSVYWLCLLKLWEIGYFHILALYHMPLCAGLLLKLCDVRLSEYEWVPSMGLVFGYTLLGLWALPFDPLRSGLSLLVASLWELTASPDFDIPPAESPDTPVELKRISPTTTLQDDIAATLHNMRMRGSADDVLPERSRAHDSRLQEDIQDTFTAKVREWNLAAGVIAAKLRDMDVALRERMKKDLTRKSRARTDDIKLSSGAKDDPQPSASFDHPSEKATVLMETPSSNPESHEAKDTPGMSSGPNTESQPAESIKTTSASGHAFPGEVAHNELPPTTIGETKPAGAHAASETNKNTHEQRRKDDGLSSDKNGDLLQMPGPLTTTSVPATTNVGAVDSREVEPQYHDKSTSTNSEGTVHEHGNVQDTHQGANINNGSSSRTTRHLPDANTLNGYWSMYVERSTNASACNLLGANVDPESYAEITITEVDETSDEEAEGTQSASNNSPVTIKYEVRRVVRPESENPSDAARVNSGAAVNVAKSTTKPESASVDGVITNPEGSAEREASNGSVTAGDSEVNAEPEVTAESEDVGAAAESRSDTEAEPVSEPDASTELKVNAEPDVIAEAEVDVEPKATADLQSNPESAPLASALEDIDLTETHEAEDIKPKPTAESTPVASVLKASDLTKKQADETQTTAFPHTQHFLCVTPSTTAPLAPSVYDQSTSGADQNVSATQDAPFGVDIVVSPPTPIAQDPSPSSSDNDAASLSSVSLSSGAGSDWSVISPAIPTAAGDVVVAPQVTTRHSDSFLDVPQQLEEAMGWVDGEGDGEEEKEEGKV